MNELREVSELNVIERAPAAFGIGKDSNRSDSYDFISTDSIMETFREANWIPHSASQRKMQKKNINKADFTKHLITFQNPNLPSINGIFPQINLINSHNGSSSFVMMAGLFRFVCENGLIVSDAEFEKIKIRHRFLNPDIIADSIKQIVDVVPDIIGKVDKMQSTLLSEIDRISYARNVTESLWGKDKAPFEPIQLLEVRRNEDKEPNLWNVYNSVQENIFKGGIIGKTSNGKKRKTRGITNIEKTVSVNQILWQETSNFLIAA